MLTSCLIGTFSSSHGKNLCYFLTKITGELTVDDDVVVAPVDPQFPATSVVSDPLSTYTPEI